MIINKIQIKNFYRFGNQEQTLDLTGTGITGVLGNNGYGKSTAIIDSLLFVFYGKCRCDSIDDVVNRYIGKDCKVSVDFTEENKSYKIIRYRTHSTHKNNVYIFENDKDISGHTAAETNAKIIDIIKMNYIAFTNSAVFSSELYSAFLANKVSERLIIFENILSLKEINAFYAECKSVIKELNETREATNLQIASAEAEINTIKNTISTYSNNAKEKLYQMKASKENLKLSIKEAEEKIKELSIVNVDVEKAKLNNNTLLEEYQNKINSIKEELKSFVLPNISNEMLIVDKYKNINFEENRIKEEKYKEDLETIKARENGYTVLQQTNNTTKEQIRNLEININSLQNEQSENLKKIDSLNSALCPFCGQHLTSERAELELKKLKNRKEEIEDLIADDNEQLEQLNLKYKEDTEQYNWLVADANKLRDNLNKDFVPNTDFILEQYTNAVNKIKEVKQTEENQMVRKTELNNSLKDYEIKLSNLEISNYTEEELNSIADKILNCKKEIEDYNNKIATIDGSVKAVYDKSYIEGLNKEIEEKQKNYEAIKKELNGIDYDLKHYSYLADCFSNKSGGFKKYFIGEMIELFNAKINQYLPFFFTEEVKIEFDKDLNDKIYMDGFEVGFNSFSQGQRQRAELAISFALFDVARVYFSNDNKLLILDEMDKGLDKFGIKSMINLLKGFDNQLRIFIVSHNPLLEDEIESKIKIKRDSNGFSVIEQ
jgi:DNA repair exonuclease SbcCD ATPase subunit